jgi:SWI/SNF-related matrix-associated actin-dependent regulator of chromatin subfamily A member 5
VVELTTGVAPSADADGEDLAEPVLVVSVAAPADPSVVLLTEAEAEAQAEDEWRRLRLPLLDSTRLEQELAASELPESQRLLKDRLLSEGFSRWGKRDLRTVVAACERHGRAARDAVISEVVESTSKDVAEVGRYLDAFLTRGPAELADWDKINDRITKGEQRLRRRKLMEELIADRVARTPDPYRTLSLPYHLARSGQAGLASVAKGGFSLAEDRFLVCSLNKLGYGAWGELAAEVQDYEGFRFNWFIKSRTPEDLHRRCDMLIRILEKEAGVDQLIAGPAADGGKARGRVSFGASAAGRKRGRKSKADLAVEAAAAAAGAASDAESAPEDDEDDEAVADSKRVKREA